MGKKRGSWRGERLMGKKIEMGSEGERGDGVKKGK